MLDRKDVQCFAGPGNSYPIIHEMRIVPFKLQEISRLAIGPAVLWSPLRRDFSFEEHMIRMFKVVLYLMA